MDNKPILFYGHHSRHYGCFSNFSAHPIEIKGRVWPTTEHYFQAMKFEGRLSQEETVRGARTPAEAKRLGRLLSPMRPDWELIKDSIMEEAVLAKFTQHRDIRRILLQTGDAPLVEHTKSDSYWGDGGDGSGRNQLGKTLMRVREQLENL